MNDPEKSKTSKNLWRALLVASLLAKKHMCRPLWMRLPPGQWSSMSSIRCTSCCGVLGYTSQPHIYFQLPNLPQRGACQCHYSILPTIVFDYLRWSLLFSSQSLSCSYFAGQGKHEPLGRMRHAVKHNETHRSIRSNSENSVQTSVWVVFIGHMPLEV